MMMTRQQAIAEADRCLMCFEPPCTASCPVHIDIPGFIAMVRSGNATGAAEVVRSSNVLASSCGRVCPQEIYCQGGCLRAGLDVPVQIRELHAYATANGPETATPLICGKAGERVAVVGAGPAGLACAYELAKLGHGVDVYDQNLPGGVPRTSIPETRLPASDLARDIDFLSHCFSMHCQFITRDRFSALRLSHRAIFLAMGLGRDKRLGIEGEDLPGVYPVLEFLEKAKSDPVDIPRSRRLVVIGGGNVSLDAAATARRLGVPEVILLYRRTELQMRTWKSEMDEARRTGVEFRFLTIPVRILGTDRVEGIECRRARLSSRNDPTGRPVPEEVPGTDHVIDADMVVTAIGQTIKQDWLSTFAGTPAGFLRVDGEFRTSEPDVFAGGDLVCGEGTIVQSVAHGRHAAHAIHRLLADGGKTS